jgi:hypothetical protein
MLEIEQIWDLEDILPNECIEAICQRGPNDAAVKEWRDKLEFCYDIRNAKEILTEYGFEREELNECGMRSISEKLLWVAAWNVFENSKFKRS